MRHNLDHNDNHLIRCLANGGTALCLPIRISRSPHVIHMARAAGFDAIYVDMEQSNVSLEATSDLCVAAWSAGITPLVRVPALDAYYIGHVLDGGAGGVIVPHVDTPDEARAAAEAALFAPLGKRTSAGSGLAQRYISRPTAQAEREMNDRTLVVVMLESAEAIANADAIAAVDGIDMLFVGTGDLSRELGIHGQHQHAKIRQAYECAAEACRRHGRCLGVAGIKGESASQVLSDLHKLGARFLSTRTEEALLLAATREEGKALRRIFMS
jgi:2-keto-3-deoxy-L-rhamnonate aldolase RhmA